MHKIQPPDKVVMVMVTKYEQHNGPVGRGPNSPQDGV